LRARNLEFLRDTEALSWNFLFPFIVVVGFGFLFTGGSQDLFKAGVIRSGAPKATQFLETKYIQFVDFVVEDDALAKLKRHQLDILINPSSRSYWISDSSPKGYLAEKVLLSTETDWKKSTIQGTDIRYVDWLIAGLLGMNMMFSALFGVGYNIIRYRKNGVLKRLKATPLTAFEFLSAQVVSRLILMLGTAFIVYFGSHLLIHFQMVGSYFNLFVTLTLGAVCLTSLGLLVAARTASEELGGGVLNLISWPMMFMSGVWFSLEGAHPWVKKLALIFPLTHFIEAARAIMTEGATLAQVSPNLFALMIMSAVFLALGSLLFKWD